MYKTKWVALFFILNIFVLFKSYAQAPPLHKTITNKYWEILNTRTIKKNAEGQYMPYFPPALMAYNKTKIELNGYMVPIKVGQTHKIFLLSVLPIMQCQFCGNGDIPEMVEIYMKEAIKFSTKPINLEGTLIINDSDNDVATFMLANAVVKNAP
ncbi:MAG: hypothetical protein EAZ15_03775 [Sphingobacteriales bacterium]|nr:MAG: hypothetical protein EAZ15_03775 [Sphingobacteriales bacterium]